MITSDVIETMRADYHPSPHPCCPCPSRPEGVGGSWCLLSTLDNSDAAAAAGLSGDTGSIRRCRHLRATGRAREGRDRAAGGAGADQARGVAGGRLLHLELRLCRPRGEGQPVRPVRAALRPLRRRRRVQAGEPGRAAVRRVHLRRREPGPGVDTGEAEARWTSEHM